MPPQHAQIPPRESSNIVIPGAICSNEEFSGTDSFTSDFEGSSESEVTNDNNPSISTFTDEIYPIYGHSSESDSSGDSSMDARQIFRECTLQLEECITWDAVKDFSPVRSDWRRRVENVGTPQEAAKLLIEFSTHLVDDAMYDPEYIREDWTIHTNSPNLSFNMLCGMLLALEETLNDEYNTFSASWSSIVDSWRERLEEAEEEAIYDSDDF